MLQVLQNLRTGETRVVEVPIPTPQPGTALVRTAASLVSAGTERTLVSFAEKSLVAKARARPDLARQVMEKARQEGVLPTLEAAFNRLDQPMALGYSSSGTVESVGQGVQGLRAGQRVACAGGGYAVHAEYALVPENLLTPLPDAVDFESAAFTTLGAIALHGFRLAEVQLGGSLVVIGLGLLGLLAGQIAAAAGCRVLGVDIDPQRAALAGQLGIEAVGRDSAEAVAAAFSRGRGCDAILICAATSSDDPVTLAGQIARDRARVVAIGAVGLELPRKPFYDKELTFLVSRSYGPGRYDPAYEEKGHDYPVGYVRWTEGRNMEAVVDLLAEERLQVQSLVTHRFPVAQAPEAYELITGRRNEPYLGVLLTYPETKEPGSGIQEVAITPPAAPTLTQPGAPLARVRLGVLGAGNFAAAVLLPAIQGVDSVDLVGVVSASGTRAETARRRFGFQYASSEEARLYQDPGVNTIAVLTRHHLHARQVLAALGAGKHVFCEKPLALTEADLNAIEQALHTATLTGEDPGRQHRKPAPRLMVGFNRRFAPLARRIAEFLAGRQEPLMAHYRVNAGYLPPEHWLHDPEQGGGRIVGEACHFIDFLTFLVGQPPVAVSARGLPPGDRYREDNVLLTLSFPDGSLGSVAYLANGDRAFPKERVEVFNAGRVAVLDDFRLLHTVQGGRHQRRRSRLRQDKGHRAEWEAMARSLTTGGEPPIPYDQLFGVSRASLAALEALRTGREIRFD